jgi:hypothetical protein
MDNGQQVIRKAHLSFQLSWAKKKKNTKKKKKKQTKNNPQNYFTYFYTWSALKY